MSQKFYILISGKKRGPYSSEEALWLYQQGLINEEFLANDSAKANQWKSGDGLSGWKPIRSLIPEILKQQKDDDVSSKFYRAACPRCASKLNTERCDDNSKVECPICFSKLELGSLDTGTPYFILTDERKEYVEELRKEKVKPSDHELFGLTETSSPKELDAAYQFKNADYQRENLSRLGVEFEDLANRKLKELNEAHQRLKPKLEEHERIQEELKNKINIYCPSCGKEFSVKEELFNQEVNCPYCEQPVIVQNTEKRQASRITNKQSKESIQQNEKHDNMILETDNTADTIEEEDGRNELLKRNRKILWSIVVVIWFVLNAYVIRPVLNPHYVNPSYHIPLSLYEGKWEELNFYQEEEGYFYLPEKWRDPETKKVYHMDHPEVIDGIKKEKWARGIVTFLAGIPIILFNYLRSHYREDYWHQHIKLTELRNNMIVLIIVSLLSGLSEIAEYIVIRAEGLLFCFLFIAPFIFWEKIKTFFTGKDKTLN